MPNNQSLWQLKCATKYIVTQNGAGERDKAEEITYKVHGFMEVVVVGVIPA